MYGDTNIRPFFQPMVSIDDGNIFAYEVLGRILVDQRVQSLGPFFHDPRTEIEQKLKVDRLVRFQALQKIEEAPGEPLLFINIQADWLIPYLKKGDPLPTLTGMQRHGIPGEKIVIEICEDYCHEIDKLSEIVALYRQAGCRIAIDDIGSAFSNLERIAVMHPDYLKVGTSFIERGQRGRLGPSLLKSLGRFCEMAGISLILEEVEHQEHLLLGLDNGVRHFQGYFFSPAQAGFQKPDQYKLLIQTGIDTYFRGQMKRMCTQRDFEKKYNSFIQNALADTGIAGIFAEGFLGKLLVPTAPPEWRRVFVCRLNGEQISSNFSREKDGSWLEQAEYRGRNWCWRPYFSDRVTKAVFDKAGSLSDAYRDLESGGCIWTFVCPLCDGTYLFIDTDYPENMHFGRR